MSQDQAERVWNALENARVEQQCPRCTNDTYHFFTGYIDVSAQPPIGQSSLQVAVLICKRCGFIAQHALPSLGLANP